MILCFSGTGNSRYIAKRIADALQDEVVDLNAKIKAADRSPVQTGRNIIVVTPTYAWRIPRVVSEWISGTELVSAERIWFVMDCGSEIGNAAKYNRRLAEQKRLRYMGTAQIIMPENYIAMFDAPEAEEAGKIVEKAEPDIDDAIAHIKTGQAFTVPRNNLYDRIMSGPVNPVFYQFFVKAAAFHANSACIGCGQCVRNCPMNSIKLENGKPSWGKECTHCMAHSASRIGVDFRNGISFCGAHLVCDGLRQRDRKCSEIQPPACRTEALTLHGHGADYHAGELYRHV